MTKRKKRIKIKPILCVIGFITVLILGICFFNKKIFVVELDSYLINLGDNFDHHFIARYKGKDVSNEVTIDLRDLDTNKAGKYEILFKYKNKTRTLIVEVKDEMAPVIDLFNGSKINIPINESYADPGYKATDNVDGDISDKVLVEGKVDTNKAGEYKINYQVTDKAGNITTSERTVIVGGKSPLTLNITNFSLKGYYQNALLGQESDAPGSALLDPPSYWPSKHAPPHETKPR